MTRTLYEILGVQQDAASDTIKRSFKQLALQYHPDVNKDPKAVESFKEINEAYKTLGDDTLRMKYDAFVLGKFPTGPFSNMKTENIPKAPGHQQSTNWRPEPGENIHIDVTLSLEESISGCKKKLTVKGFHGSAQCVTCGGGGAKPGSRRIACTACGGNGQEVQHSVAGHRVRRCSHCRGNRTIPITPCKTCRGTGKGEFEKEVEIGIPAGVENDSGLRVAGHGSPGQPPGDLMIKVKVAPHPIFRREGKDLHANIKLPLKTIMMGGVYPFKDPMGKIIDINIPQGTQPGAKVYLPGAGCGGIMSKMKGDMILHVEINFPQVISAKAQHLLGELCDELEKS